jgi:hypothetical protein
VPTRFGFLACCFICLACLLLPIVRSLCRGAFVRLVQAKKWRGKTAAELARSNKREEVAALLEAKAASPPRG